MTEEPKDAFPEAKIQMQTLFAKLTEIIITSCKTPKDALDLMSCVASWAGLTIATLIVMVSGNSPDKAVMTINRISHALNQEMKKHYTMIRGLQNKATGKEESRIIVPRHLKEV